MGTQDPPAQPAAWQKLAKVEKVADKTIHSMALNSASKLKVEQYLMLRVLWKPQKRFNFDPAMFGLDEWMEKASRELNAYRSWNSYCANFTNDQLPEGTFALPRFYQKQVSQVPEVGPFNYDVAAGPPTSPIASRTRSHLAARMRETSLYDTPSKPPKTPPSKTYRFDEGEGEGESDGESEGEVTPWQAKSYGPLELLAQTFPRTKDEQIVNTALIDFLNAFIVHHGSPVQWSLHRKPFIADFAKSSIEARTDGCLEEVDSPNRVHALVEVKPALRELALFPIAMQEAAQMVTWIKTNPDPQEITHSCGLNEIYITFAEYDRNYVKYLNDELSPTEDPGFLLMHQFGPWDTEVAADMKAVGKILLAIVLRADESCRKLKKEESRRKREKGRR
ncbi:uncharacterized protein N7459_005183 [Penicillium hispanicum]|uniref:uncharacterized protein n=1 Tax=Penicillium hispanicum TaxID=1080232 RepID=UPI0025403D23|nr:uncharacterized protein N7459_005183 [Penicillium hispanicum]KAJ5585383.1 hypothetical protein N7459_005183 [Penicillium hispanicum]